MVLQSPECRIISYRAWSFTLYILYAPEEKLTFYFEGAIVVLTQKQPQSTVASTGVNLGPFWLLPCLSQCNMKEILQAVLKNIEVKGSTMGSRKEFTDMIEFMKKTKAKPVVSHVAKGLNLDSINDLFEQMKQGSQFGKLVVDLAGSQSKL